MNNNQFFFVLCFQLQAAHTAIPPNRRTQKCIDISFLFTSTMPRKQTKHETERNNIKFMVWLLFSILSDFDLIVVFNVIFSVPRMGFVINILPLFLRGFNSIEFDKLLCCVVFFFSSPGYNEIGMNNHNCAYIANT